MYTTFEQRIENELQRRLEARGIAETAIRSACRQFDGLLWQGGGKGFKDFLSHLQMKAHSQTNQNEQAPQTMSKSRCKRHTFFCIVEQSATICELSVGCLPALCSIC